ncbi:aldo/keto reductase [Neoaquamicrobium sediminum]|uniref:aldo/keto reductase n=1 Tax=Neoaquamicrobium sediminum TaxID=1849104 RepID=UPI001563B44E|nr:aldo/keto reductase [Mesorhizobium sediminum]NRC53424.1 aldo/keto reductase [Mesorhizobium sediminum]
MERVKLGEGLELSRIVYGMWRLGDDRDTSPARVQAKIEACLEQGITTIDQADIYGGYGAEALLGACLKAEPALRDRLEIVTKCGIVAPMGRYAERRVKHYDTSANHIRASIDQSLRAMGIERIDLLLIHRPDPFMDHHETGVALDEAVRSGKVRAVGVSNFRPHDWNLLQSAMKSPLLTNQIELSLLAHEAFIDGDVAFLQERAIAPMAWSPLGGGRLVRETQGPLAELLAGLGEKFGVDAGAVAVAWLLAHPARILPVLGTNDPARIARLADAFTVPMDRETWFELYTAALGREVA